MATEPTPETVILTQKLRIKALETENTNLKRKLSLITEAAKIFQELAEEAK